MVLVTRDKWWMPSPMGLLRSATGVLLLLAVGSVVLKYNHWKKFQVIDNRIKEGSCPGLSVDQNWKINRQEVKEMVLASSLV